MTAGEGVRSKHVSKRMWAGCKQWMKQHLEQLGHDQADGFILGLAHLLGADHLGQGRQDEGQQMLLVAATCWHCLCTPLQARHCQPAANQPMQQSCQAVHAQHALEVCPVSCPV